MADSDFDDLLTMTCTIQRKTAGAADGHGQPTVTWTTDVTTGVSCLLESMSADTIVDGMRVTEKRFNLMLPAGTSITEESRVVSIARKSDSSVVNAGPLSVLEVRLADEAGGAAHHLEAILDYKADS